MAYATTDQIKDAAGGAVGYVQVFDWDVDGVADTVVIARLQAEVEAWLNGYLGTRFGVPLADPSGAFAALVADEVVFKARTRRNLATDDHRTLHEERVSWVKDMAAGRAVPSDPQPAPAAAVRSAWVTRDDDPISRSGLEGAW